MVFVTVDEDRVRIETLTRLLVCTFPGSVIYQYTDPVFAIFNMEKRKIDVVFVNLSILQKNNWKFLELLRRKKPNQQVFILADDEQLRDTAMEYGAWEYLVRPVTGQKLHEAIHFMIEEQTGQIC